MRSSFARQEDDLGCIPKDRKKGERRKEKGGRRKG
jgi:hypothetical protein